VVKCFRAEVETQLKQRVKILRTDHGCEYLSNLFKEFCEENAMCRQLMIPSNSQQNDIAIVGIEHCLTWLDQ